MPDHPCADFLTGVSKPACCAGGGFNQLALPGFGRVALRGELDGSFTAPLDDPGRSQLAAARVQPRAASSRG